MGQRMDRCLRSRPRLCSRSRPRWPKVQAIAAFAIIVSPRRCGSHNAFHGYMPQNDSNYSQGYSQNYSQIDPAQNLWAGGGK
jgi:hypothetical protein